MASGGRRNGAGAKRTPTNLRVLRGNPSRRPTNEREPDPPRGVPDPPVWLNVLELEAWQTLTDALEPMGVLTISDGPALTGLAQAWAEWREARATVDLEGTYYDVKSEGDQTTWIRKHPAVGVAADAWRRVASLLAEFGLTPSARSRLEVAAAGDPDRFAEFLGKRRTGGQ